VATLVGRVAFVQVALGAPVRKTHRMPLSTSLGSRQGQPRPSARPGGLGIRGSNTSRQVGSPTNSTNLRRRSFTALLKRANLPRVRFHDLRHTCATLLLGRNVHPKYVQELLGHANIAITLDTYSHLLPDMQEKAAQAIEVALRS
jgi:integrase